MKNKSLQATSGKSLHELPTSEALLESLETFLELVPVGRFSRNTRQIILSYLKRELPIGIESFLPAYLQDLESFFAFLDVLEPLQDPLALEELDREE